MFAMLLARFSVHRQPGLISDLPTEHATNLEFVTDRRSVFVDGASTRSTQFPRICHAGRPAARAFVRDCSQAAAAHRCLDDGKAQCSHLVGFLFVEVDVGIAIVWPQLDTTGTATLAVIICLLDHVVPRGWRESMLLS